MDEGLTPRQPTPSAAVLKRGYGTFCHPVLFSKSALGAPRIFSQTRRYDQNLRFCKNNLGGLSAARYGAMNDSIRRVFRGRSPSKMAPVNTPRMTLSATMRSVMAGAWGFSVDTAAHFSMRQTLNPVYAQRPVAFIVYAVRPYYAVLSVELHRFSNKKFQVPVKSFAPAERATMSVEPLVMHGAQAAGKKFSAAPFYGAKSVLHSESVA